MCRAHQKPHRRFHCLIYWVSSLAFPALSSWPHLKVLLQAVERAEGYRQTVCQLSAQLAELQNEKAALSEEVLQLKEDCQAAGIRADAQASALQAIQPLLIDSPQPPEGIFAFAGHSFDALLWLRLLDGPRSLYPACYRFLFCSGRGQTVTWLHISCTPRAIR